MSHTLWVILGGLCLLGYIYGFQAVRGGALRRALPLFAAIWALAAAVNLWVGIAYAGYSFAEELPVFLLVFAVPVLIGWGLARWRR